MLQCVQFYTSSGSVDQHGGFFHYFKDSGEVYNSKQRHLVSSTRIVFVFSAAYKKFGDAKYLQHVDNGVRFLRSAHRDARTAGYAWTLDGVRPEDSTYHCYGAAFVMLAYSSALACGLSAARDYIEETWDLLER